jgi:hypothetical protein
MKLPVQLMLTQGRKEVHTPTKERLAAFVAYGGSWKTPGNVVIVVRRKYKCFQFLHGPRRYRTQLFRVELIPRLFSLSAGLIRVPSRVRLRRTCREESR